MLLSRFVSDKMLRVHFSSQLKIQNEQWVSIACQLANVTVCLYCDVSEVDTHGDIAEGLCPAVYRRAS